MRLLSHAHCPALGGARARNIEEFGVKFRLFEADIGPGLARTTLSFPTFLPEVGTDDRQPRLKQVARQDRSALPVNSAVLAAEFGRRR